MINLNSLNLKAAGAGNLLNNLTRANLLQTQLSLQNQPAREGPPAMLITLGGGGANQLGVGSLPQHIILAPQHSIPAGTSSLASAAARVQSPISNLLQSQILTVDSFGNIVPLNSGLAIQLSSAANLRTVAMQSAAANANELAQSRQLNAFQLQALANQTRMMQTLPQQVLAHQNSSPGNLAGIHLQQAMPTNPAAAAALLMTRQGSLTPPFAQPPMPHQHQQQQQFPPMGSSWDASAAAMATRPPPFWQASVAPPGMLPPQFPRTSSMPHAGPLPPRMPTPPTSQQAQNNSKLAMQLLCSHNKLVAAFRVGLLALDALARSVHGDRPQQKFAKSPPYGVDVKWLLAIGMKLGIDQLQPFCAKAMDAVVSPYVLYDLTMSIAFFLALQPMQSGPAPPTGSFQQPPVSLVSQSLVSSGVKANVLRAITPENQQSPPLHTNSRAGSAAGNSNSNKSASAAGSASCSSQHSKQSSQSGSELSTPAHLSASASGALAATNPPGSSHSAASLFAPYITDVYTVILPLLVQPGASNASFAGGPVPGAPPMLQSSSFALNLYNLANHSFTGGVANELQPLLLNSLTGPLHQKCLQMFVQSIYQRLHFITPAEFDEFASLIVHAQVSSCFSSEASADFYSVNICFAVPYYSCILLSLFTYCM